MADFHQLIARAVSGLENDTAENRRVLYERARTALLAQLRGIVPALDDSEITRERLALEEAIRKVEVESARRARETPRSVPKTAKREAEAARRAEAARPSAAAQSLPVVTPTIAPVTGESMRDKPAAKSVVRAGLWPQSEHAALLDEALKEFRDVAGGSESQGAPIRAERSAPGIRPAFTPAESIPARLVQPPPVQQQLAVQPPQQTPPLQPSSPLPVVQPPNDPLQELEALMPGVSREVWRAQPAEQVRPLPNFDFDDLSSKTSPRQSFRQMEERAQAQVPRSLRSYRRPIWILIVLLAVSGVAALGYWHGGDIMQSARSMIQSFRSPATQVQKGTAPTQQKSTDRIGQPATPESSKSGTSLTQRAMLTTEPDVNNPRGKDYVGTANWRIETIPAGPGRAAEVAIKLEVEIPDRGLAMSWLIRRNTDSALPASHTIDIEFNMAPNSPLGRITDVRSLLMKQPGQVEGAPLWGHAQKSTPNYFLVGLSAVEADAQYNLKLLKEQPAFDVALVFSNVRRTFLLVEKGPAGERVFAEAFAAWKQ